MSSASLRLGPPELDALTPTPFLSPCRKLDATDFRHFANAGLGLLSAVSDHGR